MYVVRVQVHVLYVCGVRVWNSAHSVNMNKGVQALTRSIKSYLGTSKKDASKEPDSPQHASKITNQILDVKKIIGKKGKYILSHCNFTWES